MPLLDPRIPAACLLLLAASTAGAQSASSIDFENDLQPIFTRYGCTSGPCHGKARGQGGFQLSLLGFDHDFDYTAITKGVEVDASLRPHLSKVCC